MLIQDMMDKRDMATNFCVAIQNQIGKDIAGIFEMDELENRSNEEFHEYCLSEMKRLNLKGMIFTGWAFTKKIYEKMKEYWNYEDIDYNGFYVLFIPEIITLIVFENKEDFFPALRKLKKEIKRASTINIKEIEESDNGIIIHYFDHSVVKTFEEKPKVIEEVIQEQNDNIA